MNGDELPVAADLVRVTVDVPGVEPIDLDPDAGLAAEAARAVRRLPPRRGETTGGLARYEVVVDGWRFEATVEPAARAALRERSRRAASRTHAGRHVIHAPIPGRIVHVWVQPGDHVAAGTRLCSLEAMKMENEVLAHQAGIIERVSASEGAKVELGDELVVIG